MKVHNDSSASSKQHRSVCSRSDNTSKEPTATKMTSKEATSTRMTSKKVTSKKVTSKKVTDASTMQPLLALVDTQPTLVDAARAKKRVSAKASGERTRLRDLPRSTNAQSALKLKKRVGPMRWGGRRPNAGRPRLLQHDPLHAIRPHHLARHPSHITLRVVPDIGRLRKRELWKVFEYAAIRLGESDDFRLVHYSIQSNHLHLLVEASNAETLANGVMRFEVIVAKRLNKKLRRKGKAFAHRYHRVDITTPRQMRHALSYVLCNWRRHREDVQTPGAENVLLDPYSTAWAFDGWRDLDDVPPWRLPCAPPRTWLMSVGWRRCGLLGVREVPGRL